MKKVKSSKLLLKIISAGIAIGLWFAITYTEDPVISQTLPGIGFITEGEDILYSKGLAVVNKNEFPTITVTIRGSRSNVISSMGDVSAKIDISEISEPGEFTVPVSYVYASSKVSLEKTKTREIPVKVEKLISRDIPVKIEVENRDKNEDIVVKNECRSDTMSVKGAESIIYKVSYVKVQVDVSNISKTSTQEYLYKFYDEKNNEIPRDQIISGSSDTVSVISTVYKKTELPIKVVLGEDKRNDYGFSVKSMESDTVDAGLEDGVSVDFIEAEIVKKAEKGGYEAELIPPDGVYVPEDERTLIINGEILPKESKEIEVPVLPVNIPDGKIAEISPEKKTVTLKTFENITAADVSATVDVSKMTAEEETVKAEITTEKDAEIIGTYSVTVKIRDKE